MDAGSDCPAMVTTLKDAFVMESTRYFPALDTELSLSASKETATRDPAAKDWLNVMVQTVAPAAGEVPVPIVKVPKMSFAAPSNEMLPPVPAPVPTVPVGVA